LGLEDHEFVASQDYVRSGRRKKERRKGVEGRGWEGRGEEEGRWPLQLRGRQA
jgi:hypothetical protein